MGLFDFVEALFRSNFRFDPKVWSEPHVHELHTNLIIPKGSSGTTKVLKQVRRILNYGGVTNNSGIYLIREYGVESYTYVGQTLKLGIRTRLSQHLSERGSKGLKQGVLYEIRWATTSNIKDNRGSKTTCVYGEGAEQVAEALAILFFRPLENLGNDWKGNLTRERKAGRSQAIRIEAERLGFLSGSKESNKRFLDDLLGF